MEKTIAYAFNSPNFQRPQVHPTGIVVRFAEQAGSIQEVASNYNSVTQQAPHALVTKGHVFELLPFHPAKKTVTSANICGYGRVRQSAPTKIGVFVVKEQFSVLEWRETLIEYLAELCQTYGIKPQNIVTQGELYCAGMASRHIEFDCLMTQIRWSPEQLRINVAGAIKRAAAPKKEEIA